MHDDWLRAAAVRSLAGHSVFCKGGPRSLRSVWSSGLLAEPVGDPPGRPWQSHSLRPAASRMRSPSAAAPTRTPAPRWAIGPPSLAAGADLGLWPGRSGPNPNAICGSRRSAGLKRSGVSWEERGRWSRQCGGWRYPLLQKVISKHLTPCALICLFFHGVLRPGQVWVRFHVCVRSCPFVRRHGPLEGQFLDSHS